MIELFPDQTIFIMWGLFLTVLAALHFLVFKPTLKIIEARKNNTENLQVEIQRLESETNKALITFEEKIAQARSKAVLKRESLLNQAREKEAQILSKARSDNEALLEKLKSQINHDKKEAEFSLRQHAQELAQEIVAKVLEKKVA